MTTDRINHTLEGNVLMRHGIEKPFARPIENFLEGRISSQGRPQNDCVDEQADQRFGFDTVASGHRDPDEDIRSLAQERNQRVRKAILRWGTGGMTEAAISAPADLSADLDRIEAAVLAGNTDLTALGFWRLVALVKPDRLLVDRYAEQIGRIDGAAFRAFTRFRMPVWLGNTILLIGAAVGFLWYNAFPAEVFMGDTGSMALGGAMAGFAIVMKVEVLLLFIGGIYLIEAVSVIIQVFWYKRTGRRVFKMAPIHHHFEQMGWSEPTVVIRFWIISFVLALAALSTLKLR